MAQKYTYRYTETRVYTVTVEAETRQMGEESCREIVTSSEPPEPDEIKEESIILMDIEDMGD